MTLAVVATLTVTVAATPAEICPVGAVTVMPVRGLSVTLSVAVLPATFAVMSASRVVLSTLAATPLLSVVAVAGLRLTGGRGERHRNTRDAGAGDILHAGIQRRVPAGAAAAIVARR